MNLPYLHLTRLLSAVLKSRPTTLALVAAGSMLTLALPALNQVTAQIAGHQRGDIIQGRATILDADTIELMPYKKTRIRLFGIDAPETGQTCWRANGASYLCGKVSAFALADKIGTGPVICKIEDLDTRYNRLVATCYKDDIDLNGWLVSTGNALAYRRYSNRYIQQEEKARLDQAGLWNGAFTNPAEWRRHK